MSIEKAPPSYPAVKTVFLSSNVGKDNTLEDYKEKVGGKLFRAGFNIVNGNSKDPLPFGLTSLEEKIVKAGDAFVFLPIPSAPKNGTLYLKQPAREDFFREMFKAASLFVGMQTKDPLLRLDGEDPASPFKPFVIINKDGCWNPFLKLVDYMHELGTIREEPQTLMQVVKNFTEALPLLQNAHKQKAAPKSKSHHKPATTTGREDDPNEERRPDFNVCVFCSASTKNPQLLNSAYEVGKAIADEGWGVISGMGCMGMMGKVVEGANASIRDYEARFGKEETLQKGWVGGSNLPRIIDMEGLPERFDKLWLHDDIYSRMEVMIEKSQAFMIMPGGIGTVQELMALMLLKHAHEKEAGPYLMRDEKFGNKPIVLVNQKIKVKEKNKNGKIKEVEKNFWDPLVEMAHQYGFKKDEIKVVETVEEGMEFLKTCHDRSTFKHEKKRARQAHEQHR